jgi:hypothetical protein
MGIFKWFRKKDEASKKSEKPEKLIFTADAILFIKKYAIPELSLTNPLDEDQFDEICTFADDCELDMIDENGEDKQYDYPEKERDILGDKFVTFMSHHADIDYYIDYDELSKLVF